MAKDNIDRRQIVLDTALKMIVENGIQAASMGKISKESGVAVGTIYHHFSSKEDLIRELYKEVNMKILKKFISIPKGDKPYETFCNLIKSIISYGLENPDEYEFMERYSRNPVIGKALKMEMEQMLRKESSNFFNNIPTKKNVKELPYDLSSIYISGAISEFIRAQIYEEIQVDNEHTDIFIKMIWNGLTK
ncbi:TetR/AcrR family transcriptional regulator [Anaeromicrobium sediminis]|uniref:HTH tetR-type domain-containing protein n=1 Tax=Anaeromicrobium sediminis TaxID=1478221 RepID=A0A267MJ65_9FIRM|nr:TetR/AcrR family transcriptional regulator [Anaeromicrobium sediminis]PAB59631.1 hypothetical protein CCE28_08665 [Anaeromicrobium sediminis]